MSRDRQRLPRAFGPKENELSVTAGEGRRRGRADQLAIKGRLLDRLLDELGRREVETQSEVAVAAAVREFVDDLLGSGEILPLNENERSRLAEELTQEAIGLGPLAPLLADPAVTDILVNGPDQVYVERFGQLEATKVRFRDSDHVLRVIERLASRVGRRIDAAWPMVDVRLPDGSRVNATIPPVALDGPTLSIRRFGRRRLQRTDLLRLKMMSPEMMRLLEAAVVARENILIAGGTGAGKSTLLGALAEAIPNGDRIITIEDTSELVLDQDHVVRLESRPPNLEGQGEITARQLLINSLRMRPDRIIIGESRGPEALDMLQAMNTGHEGSMSTVHANSPRDALARIETMVLMAGIELPHRAIREQISTAIGFVVFVRRFEDGVRRVESIAELVGREDDTIQMQEIFTYRRSGQRGRGKHGNFVPTGTPPRRIAAWRERRIDLPLEIFQRSSGPSGA